MPTSSSPSTGRPLGAMGLVAALLVPIPAAGPARAEAPRGKIAVDPETPHLTKASSHLLRARAVALAGRGEAAMRSEVPGLRISRGRVDVEIKVSGVTGELVRALAERGLEVESSHPAYGRVYGRLDPARLAAVTALPEVRIVRPKPRAGRRVGAAENQGDETMAADVVRSTLGWDGSGVTIGILSDSFHKTPGLGGSESGGACDCSTPGSTCANVVTGMTNQASGDLPVSVAILDDCTTPSF